MAGRPDIRRIRCRNRPRDAGPVGSVDAGSPAPGAPPTTRPGGHVNALKPWHVLTVVLVLVVVALVVGAAVAVARVLRRR
jgi:hypothetical protein